MDISKDNEYEQFVVWIATPPALRRWKNQRSLASYLGVHESTLSDWKKVPEFWDKVKEKRQLWGKDRTTEVIEAFYKKILKNPTARDVELWLTYFDEQSSKEPEDVQRRRQTAKLDAILAELMSPKVA